MEKFYHNSPFGTFVLEIEKNAIISLNTVSEIVTKSHNETLLASQFFVDLEKYFQGELKKFNYTLNPNGTIFQKKVWLALQKIDYGKTKSYKEIATQIGNEKAVRAVGMACHKNPIMILIPCHRVIGKNGKLTGYAGGLKLKEKLLNLEK